MHDAETPRAWWWWPSWWVPPAASATNCCASSNCSTWPAPRPGRCNWSCSYWWCSRLSTRSRLGSYAILRYQSEPGSSMASADPVIRFKDVSKVFQRPDGRGDFVAVDKLSFEIGKGEIVAVLGKTGCGKSTMFNIVA